MRLVPTLTLILSVVLAQDYTWPTNTGKHLSSNFGEFRTTGYHLGLDIKTREQRDTLYMLWVMGLFLES